MANSAEPFQIENLKSLPDDTPFSMLNALWFKPDGGRESYAAYMQATLPIIGRFGAKSGRPFVPQPGLYGELDADLVFFVHWPNKAAFWGMITDPEYQAISHLRMEAITKSLLIPCLAATF